MIVRTSLTGKMPSLEVLAYLLALTIGFQSCKDNTQTPSNTRDYSSQFRGQWIAREGHINDYLEIGRGTGFLYYNWYVINSQSASDSVKITWDNGLNCTTSKGVLLSDSIVIDVYSIHTSLRLLNDTSIYMSFHLPDTTYWKKLVKQSNDTTFLCM